MATRQSMRTHKELRNTVRLAVLPIQCVMHVWVLTRHPVVTGRTRHVRVGAFCEPRSRVGLPIDVVEGARAVDHGLHAVGHGVHLALSADHGVLEGAVVQHGGSNAAQVNLKLLRRGGAEHPLGPDEKGDPLPIGSVDIAFEVNAPGAVRGVGVAPEGGNEQQGG